MIMPLFYKRKITEKEMRKEQFIFLFVVMFLASTASFAQNYRTGIGLRGGPGYGITVKHFVGDKSALEGIISPRWQGIMFTGMYQKHAVAFDAKRLQYYGGIGGHIGFYDYQNRNSNNNPWLGSGDSHTIAGADLILGIEYTFSFIPFNIGVDWKPSLNLWGDDSFWFNDVAFSLRFIPGNM
jgi:hypothetical protein